MPSEAISSVPWMPAPSKIPIQRALIGSSGPGGIDLAGEARRPRRESGTCQDGFSCLSWIVVEACGRLEACLADRDRVGLGQLQVLPEAQR